MKCRELKVWYDEDEKKNENLVWFGSYGKDVLAKENKVNLLSPFPFIWVEYKKESKCYMTPDGEVCQVITTINPITSKGQSYYLNFTTKEVPAIISLIGENGNIIDSITVNEIKSYSFKGILSEPIFSVEIFKDNFENAEIILKEYGKAKKNLKTINGKESVASFVDEKEGIISSLTERLSVLQGELWYKSSYGQPITSITKSKILMDSFIVKVIESHPDVKSIDYFESYIENKKYYCYITINTTYGNIELKNLLI